MEQIYLLKDADLDQLLKRAVFQAIGELRETDLPKPKPEPEKLYTTAEACEILRCSKPTLHRWKKAGIIPFVRLGVNIRYKESDLKKLLETKK
jgi:excisionase family DNA binding protein